MVLGDLSKAVNSQNVRLKLSTDEVITLFNINKSKAHPRSRTNSRAGAADFFSNPLIQLTWDAIVTKAIFDAFATLNTLDARGKLPVGSFTIIGENLGGSSGDDITATFSATVPELSDIAGENGSYIIRCLMIVVNSTYSVA